MLLLTLLCPVEEAGFATEDLPVDVLTALLLGDIEAELFTLDELLLTLLADVERPRETELVVAELLFLETVEELPIPPLREFLPAYTLSEPVCILGPLHVSTC